MILNYTPGGVVPVDGGFSFTLIEHTDMGARVITDTQVYESAFEAKAEMRETVHLKNCRLAANNDDF